jgi:pimeloyl-ACP methyl ester carboxylesterase
MRKSLTIAVVITLTFTILLGGCYKPGGPVPENAHQGVPRAYTQAQVDQAVVMQESVISAPLPDKWGAPDSCDEIHFLRFRPADGSTLDPENPQVVNPENTDAMLVMLPGILEGSNGFEYLGRQLVYAAKTQNDLNLEVWAVERRNNRLEDLSAANYLEDQLLSGKITALEAGRKAIDYYYRGKELNGRTFAGWLKNKDVPCLSEFGLQLDTEDVFKVIQTMVPDMETRKQKVFVGGHSMGGLMTSMFAGWDLDGNPATVNDAGYNNCAGLFGLDTSVSSAGGTPVEAFLKTLPKSAKPYEKLTEHLYATLLNRLRIDPNSNRILPFPLLDAEAMSLLEAISMLAYFDPETECSLIREVPFSQSAKQLLRFLFSRDITTYMDGVPQITDFRLTNEAMLGVVFDDSFAPVGMIQNSMGFLGGGTVIRKSFPADSLKSIPLVGDMLGSLFGAGPYFIANDAGPSALKLHRGPLYHWVNFDEVGSQADPDFKDTTGAITYTTNTNEVADIRDVARAIFKGPTNLTEWYFSTRLIADFMAAIYPYGRKYGLNFIHGNDFNAMPKIEFIASQGVMGSPYASYPVEGTKKVLLEGYNHMDVLTASANTPERRENGVIKPLIDFVVDNLSP